MDFLQVLTETEMAKISEHEWKGRPKISKSCRVWKSMLNTKENVHSQISAFLQMFVFFCVGQVRAAHHTNVCKLS